MLRYVHTNIIARDWKKLSRFYQEVFGCQPVPPERNLHGEWLDALTGCTNAHITGEHLSLPGYDEQLPTLEILSYTECADHGAGVLNAYGIGHIAFEVSDVHETLSKLLEAGGSTVGEVVEKQYPGIGLATFVYARDIEGNIVELQSWVKNTVTS